MTSACRGQWHSGRNTCPCRFCRKAGRLRWAFIEANEAVARMRGRMDGDDPQSVLNIVSAEMARERAWAALCAHREGGT